MSTYSGSHHRVTFLSKSLASVQEKKRWFIDSMEELQIGHMIVGISIPRREILALLGSLSRFPIGMRVLAVDDNPTCLKLLDGLLKRCQYHVLSANSDPKLVMEGINHGACYYLVKPVRLEELRNEEKVDKKLCKRDPNGKFNRKRKDENADSEDNGNEDDESSTQKKPRVVWSIDLHRKFVAAVNSRNFAESGRMVESENLSPQQPPQAHTVEMSHLSVKKGINAGDDDNFLFTMCGSPGSVSWLGSHTESDCSHGGSTFLNFPPPIGDNFHDQLPPDSSLKYGYTAASNTINGFGSNITTTASVPIEGQGQSQRHGQYGKQMYSQYSDDAFSTLAVVAPPSNVVGLGGPRNRETGRSSTELKMGQGEGCLLDQNKLQGGFVASNGYGPLDDLMNGWRVCC
ncbi:two-component response regulator ARR12 [Tanacetum coccineum]